MGPWTDAEDTLNKRLKALLEAPVTGNHAKVREAYKACMDTDRIEMLNSAPLINLFGEYELKLWENGPLHDPNWNPLMGTIAHLNWYNMISEMRKKGLLISTNVFIKFDVVPDMKDTSKYRLSVDQPKPLMPREYLVLGEADDTVKGYRDIMGKTFQLLDPTITARTAEETAMSLVQFEIKLAKIMKPKEERQDRSKLYNPMTIGEMTTKYRPVVWLEFFTKMLGEKWEDNIVAGDELKDTDMVIVGNLDYMEKLMDLLEETSLRVQMAYIMWRTITDLHEYLHDDVLNLVFQLTKEISGQTQVCKRVF